MKTAPSLADRLAAFAANEPQRRAVAATISAIAAAAEQIAARLADGALLGPIGVAQGTNQDGDIQKDLDLFADRVLKDALTAAGVAALASEESDVVDVLNPGGVVSVSIDPLDGSSNIDTNLSVGTIFSLLPATPEPGDAFLLPGRAQLAAGFVIYGPQTSLVLTTGQGVEIFTLDRRSQSFRLVRSEVRIPAHSPEFAINAANQLFWDPPIRAYIEDCLAPGEDSGSKPANMRWVGSLVAEAYRILARGGLFLYPADSRKGYGAGRLRLLYEAHPMAFIMEQAGGAASTGVGAILDVAPASLHQRVPLIMGSVDNVDRVERMHRTSDILMERNAPLFASRGFFRL